MLVMPSIYVVLYSSNVCVREREREVQRDRERGRGRMPPCGVRETMENAAVCDDIEH